MPSAGQPTSIQIDPALYENLRRFVRTQNKAAKRATTIKAELETAIRNHLAAEESQAQAEVLAPAIYQALDVRVSHLENRFASLLAKTGLDAATALYVLLYCLHETDRLIRAVQPDAGASPINVQEWYERARAKAIKHFRAKDPMLLQKLGEDAAGNAAGNK